MKTWLETVSVNRLGDPGALDRKPFNRILQGAPDRRQVKRALARGESDLNLRTVLYLDSFSTLDAD